MTSEPSSVASRSRLELTPSGVAAALTVLALFGLLSCLALRYTIDAPVQDQWSLVEDLAKYQAGSWTLADIARSHNGHRIALPRLIWVPLAFATHWRQRPEIALNLLVGLGIFALLLRSCVRELPELLSERAALLAVALAIVCASFSQWENWQWGIQLQMFLGVFLALLALRMLCRASRGFLALGGAALLGFLASFTQSAGLAVWPAGLVAILIVDAAGARRRTAAIWVGIALFTLALYLMPLPGDSPSGADPLFVMQHPLQAARFFLSVLGRLASGFSISSFPPQPTWLAPLFGMSLLAFFAHWMRTHFADVLSARDEHVAFWLACAAFSLSVAALITVGRAPAGPAAALASRYTTLMLPLWAAAIYLASVDGFPQLGVPPRTQGRVLLMAAMFCVLASSLREAPRLADRYYFVLPAREALLNGGPPDVLARLHPEVQQVLDGMEALRRMELSVYQRSSGEPGSGEALASFAQEIQVRTALPSQLTSGGTLGLVVSVRNPSSVEWPSAGRSAHPVNLSYRWMDSASGAVMLEGKRAELDAPLGPGQAIDLQMLIGAPDSAGLYLLRLSMVQEDVAWFSDRGALGWEASLEVKAP